MAFTLEISNSTSTYTFAITPYFLPKMSLEYDQSIPTNVAKRIRTWDFPNVYLVNSSTTALLADYDNLISVLKSETDPVTRVSFKKDGVEQDFLERSTYKSLEVTEVSVKQEPGIWNSFISMSITFTENETIIYSGGSGGNVSEETTSYEYDPMSGLLTISRTGKIVGASDALSSAKSRALSFPSQGEWVYETNGPDGINISVNKENTEATYTSTIKEVGVQIPSNVKNLEISESISAGVGEYRLTVNATFGAKDETTAEAVVSSILSEYSVEPITVTLNGDRTKKTYQMTAVFPIDAQSNVTIGDFDQKVRVDRTFSITGGGYALVEQPIQAGKNNTTLMTLFATGIKAFVITETVRVTALDKNELKWPALLKDEWYSPADSSFTAPTPVEWNRKGEPTKWTMSANRVYKTYDAGSMIKTLIQTAAGNVTNISSWATTTRWDIE